MASQSIQEKITSLEEQIALLPKGSIGQKTVNGKEYLYLRWTENKKRTDEELARTAFVQITRNDTLAAVNQDLKTLEEAGFRYVFFDEVTFMEDFISGAALFSDVYAASGMKIVLSGTDSLGFLFSEDEQLFDRCILLHTTFIPYGLQEHRKYQEINKMAERIVQTAGREQIGEFAPMFAHLNDDVLFISPQYLRLFY